MGKVTSRQAAAAAFVAAAINLAAAVAMLLALQPGLPVAGSQVEQRIVYVSTQTAAWRIGWLLWHAAAISLLAFYVGLAGLWSARAPILCGLAILCAAAGLAADLAAEAILMGVQPDLRGEAFAATETTAGLLTGYLGNGLYTVAGILLTWAGARELPRPLLALAVPLWGAGLALSAATMAHSTAGQFWSTAALMPLFVVWTVLVGRWLRKRGS